MSKRRIKASDIGPLEQVLKRYGGKLYSGVHKSTEGKCCILELVAVSKGLQFTDDPEAVGMPDYRQLNDGNWSTPQLRAKHMLRLAMAFEAWPEWSEGRRRRFVERLVIRTVNVLIAQLPHIGEDAAIACRAADTLKDAAAAASAAAARAARAARDAADTAAVAARFAAATAWAAVDAAADDAEATADARAADAGRLAAAAAEDPDEVLVQAVDLWVEAAEWSGHA